MQGVVDFVRLYTTATIGQRIVFDLRNAVFQHLSELSFSFYDRARTGDLMSRVTADIDVLSEFFGRAAVIVLSNLITLLGILVGCTSGTGASVCCTCSLFPSWPRPCWSMPGACDPPWGWRARGWRA